MNASKTSEELVPDTQTFKCTTPQTTKSTTSTKLSLREDSECPQKGHQKLESEFSIARELQAVSHNSNSIETSRGDGDGGNPIATPKLNWTSLRQALRVTTSRHTFHPNVSSFI
ncbi:hypothetical protein Mp_7g17060 [Marchantia polymorpha subsp. ruderalis]|uniref:Uncharacterized protein n=2 Tax=Marchantia polymorpha TaxID=3197 RepID=A0AAF6C0N0_MARPO|nr:hypothetical protein MARPO_0051s0044 [Marchantia polymorpha]BBN17814.1 hypothetical protein Mp_7g17060 [Marchantia polymorpha subsp. ruderalis]|eukprot:PTQ38440.1 hypothetical protein MARPO_0051s0044 [Marchantia polymorpha]